MQSVLIAGGSGLVGNQLTKRLLTTGYSVVWLTRKINPNLNIKQYEWDYKLKKTDANAFKDATIVINLSGANVGAKRWDKTWKEDIYNSRVQATALLMDTIKMHGKKVHTVISSSATGYYGTIISDNIFSESTGSGKDFLATTCVDWENTLSNSKTENIRKIILRTGVVLSAEGGALSKMNILFKMGLGAVLGSGKQYFSWIHIEDLCSLYVKAIEDNSINGVYNAVAPSYITNKDFTITLSNMFNKSIWLPNISAFLLKLILGEMAGSLLYGSRVSPEKIVQAGFTFRFRNIQSALKDIYDK
jgi:uncharacterized protein (TIGR01777 family)